MAMSWGYRIAVFYIVFVVAIMALVYLASKEQVDLVEKDYYEQELVYQQRITAAQNANALSSPVTIRHKGANLELMLPQEMNGVAVKADLLMYCPSNAGKDKQYPLQTTSGLLTVELPADIYGLYVIKLNWSAAGKNYYFENNISF